METGLRYIQRWAAQEVEAVEWDTEKEETARRNFILANDLHYFQLYVGIKDEIH